MNSPSQAAPASRVRKLASLPATAPKNRATTPLTARLLPAAPNHASDDSQSSILDFQPQPNPEVGPVWEFDLNDDGRGRFFLAHFGDRLRFVPELSQWRIWHAGRWHPDTTGRVGHFCQVLARHQTGKAAKFLESLSGQLAAQIEKQSADPPATPAIEHAPLTRAKIQALFQSAKKHAASLGAEKTIAALLAAAARQGSIIVPMAQWDSSPHLIGTRNGTLDLAAGEHRPGAPGDYITKWLAVTHDPAADAPEWRRFIERIMPDKELAAYLQRLAGYTLTGSTDDQAFYLLHGSGKNGKSVFVETLAGVFHDYAGKARKNLIEEPRNGADCRHDLAQLPGVRFLHGEEVSNGGKLREDVIKSLTAGDTLSGEAKYAAPFSYKPVAKLWLMGNHRPRIDGVDTGIWRRVRLIPFTAAITEEEEIPSSVLLAQFERERAGILNWMLAGLAVNGAGPVTMPRAVKAAVAEYRQAEDLLGDFVSECTQDAADTYKESKHDVFRGYQEWARLNGITSPWTMKQFTRRLGERDGWHLDGSRLCWLRKSIIRGHSN